MQAALRTFLRFALYEGYISRALDEEHRNNLALLDKVEQALARSARYDAAHASLLAQFAAALEHDGPA